MAFNIAQFQTTLARDGYRPNLFDITMQFPSFVSPGTAGQDITFLCKTAQLPGSTLGLAPLFYFGREVKLAGVRTYPDWTITVVNDESFNIRQAFEQWYKALNDPTLNLRQSAAIPMLGGYAVDAFVNAYTKDGNLATQYTLQNIWPLDLSPIDTDMGANDQIAEWSLTLAVNAILVNGVDYTASALAT
ncbi:MAG: hypothetical protein ACRDFB_04155 [Rhabdochlamydiaceae bacterium]